MSGPHGMATSSSSEDSSAFSTLRSGVDTREVMNGNQPLSVTISDVMGLRLTGRPNWLEVWTTH